MYRSAICLSVSLCRVDQWMFPALSAISSAGRKSPLCILPHAACSATFLTRCTSDRIAAPCFCLNVSKVPPRSMLASCASSPARISFAPACRAALASLPSVSVEIIAASSTTRTVSRVQARAALLERDKFAGNRCSACLNPSPRICCTTSFVHARPITFLPVGLVHGAGRFERVALAGSGLAPKDRQARPPR